MASILSTFAVLVALLLCYKLVNLYKYIQLAKGTSLPYVITPVLETEVVGFLATPILRYLYHDYLDQGKGWPKWCRFIIKDWSWEDKRLAHDELGDVFLVVSPEGIICYSADATMCWDVMNRRNDFTKPRDKYKILEPYGPNVATAEGKTFRFHVRITAPPFSDMSGANKLVWKETLEQTHVLSEAWSQNEPGDLSMDVNALTLAVISHAGFGKKVGKDTENDIPKGYTMSFLKAINDTTAYITAILLLPNWLLRLTPLRNAGVAHSQLDKYLREIIRSEKGRIQMDRNHQSSTARGNLLTEVLKASALNAESSSKTAAPGERKAAFTEDEVMGNLFIYLLAGYETTANAIAYGLITLALQPHIQRKVREEINKVYKEALAEGRNELTYDDDFEKLEYTYGFMYETFRLFPGVILITKMVNKPQNIVISDLDNSFKSYFLPAGTRVYLSSPGVQYNPKYWPSPYTLNPNRWKAAKLGSEDKADTDAGGRKTVASDKTRHMRGTLLTFSDGSRACLGRKFAQAEYMAFFASLLRGYDVGLKPGLNKKAVEKDLYLKCAGKLTLAPLSSIMFALKVTKLDT